MFSWLISYEHELKLIKNIFLSICSKKSDFFITIILILISLHKTLHLTNFFGNLGDCISLRYFVDSSFEFFWPFIGFLLLLIKLIFYQKTYSKIS